RYVKAQKCSSGFGLIHFNTDNRTIQSEAFRFLANMADRENSDNQFPGWPVTIGQLDNYGKKKLAYLKEIELNPEQQYLQLYSENTGELVYALRPESNTFKAFVFSKGQYTIRVVDEITGEVKEYKGLGIVR
ncbi:MAG: hypothetical protein HOG34_05605, partial [Bacteroidetes bacterium]|nr:hypothetical protein [Bacteroidota bacterium]